MDIQFSDLSDYDLVCIVRDALRFSSNGDNDGSQADSEKYNQIVQVLWRENVAHSEITLLKTTLKALSGAADYIDSDKHERLLSAIFNMSFWKCRLDVIDAVVEFLVSLAASSGDYLDSCLAMLTSQFLPPPKFTRKDQVLSRVHSALEDIADLVPLSPLRLVPIVLKGIEFHVLDTITTPTLVTYVENMLKLESGALGEVVRIPMLAGVVELLVDLDVKLDLGKDWDDFSETDSVKVIFEMELENKNEYVDDDAIDRNELPCELSRKTVGRNSLADKLDSVMAITLEHLESCEVGGRLNEVFETLLESFERTVLTTHKSKFAQFVIFYACSLDPANYGLRFASKLEDIFFCSESALHRVSAIGYLASYLARAKFLSVTVVARTLGRLVDWCFKYHMQDEEINPVADRIYYSGCQAIMYLLCFRMRSMMDVPKLKSQLADLPLESILNSKLNPLKVCLPSIVKEFLQQAKAAGLFMTAEKFKFEDKLESKLSRAFGGTERLDMFFPFDPCLLKKADSFVRPNYMFWSMVQRVYDEDENSSDEEVDEGFAGENVDAMDYLKEEQHFGFDEFDSALKQMSITPKDSYFRLGGALNVPMRMPSRIRPSTSPESL